jgi:hypothetical protein
VLFTWAKQDPEAALRWTESQIANQTPAQKPLLARRLMAVFGPGWNPSSRAAADLYSKIQDPALRTETLTTHVRSWMYDDPAAAKAWLESHDALTPAQAAALLQAH